MGRPSGALRNYRDEARTIRKARDALREALPALYELEADAGEVLGRYVLHPGHELDELDVAAFLLLTLADRPTDQQVEVTIRARAAGRGE